LIVPVCRIGKIGVGEDTKAFGKLGLLKQERQGSSPHSARVFILCQERFKPRPLALYPAGSQYKQRIAAQLDCIFHVDDTGRPDLEITGINADAQAFSFEPRKQPISHPINIEVAVADENVVGEVSGQRRPSRKMNAMALDESVNAGIEHIASKKHRCRDKGSISQSCEAVNDYLRWKDAVRSVRL
jgi:hypothetical protein